MSQPLYGAWEWVHYFATLMTLYFLSAGSFALNQLQEIETDRKMPRTQERPLPLGQVSKFQAMVLAIGFLMIGSISAALLNQTVLVLGLATVVLYNGTYTMWWKRKWAFGAVPGAIPGAMPVVIGYAAHQPDILQPEPLYLFLLMFLWQMPHFWSLAIRYRDDYALGNIPVLPVRVGVSKTLFHMALYLFAYVATAIAAPFFTSARWAYIILVLPIGLVLIYQFIKYFEAVSTSSTKSRWLRFFLWTNLSILIFLSAPVIDRWVGKFLADLPSNI